MNTRHCPEFALNAEALAPVLSHCQDNVSPVDFFTFQPMAKKALEAFLPLPASHLMVLKVNQAGEYLPFIEQAVKEIWKSLPTCEVLTYDWVTDDKGQKTLSPIKVSKDPEVHSALYVDGSQLFGKVVVNQKIASYFLQRGLVHRASGGVLLLSVTELLHAPRLWLRLKTLLATQTFTWQQEDFHGDQAIHTVPCPLALKVILLGNRDELARLHDLEPDLYPWADYAELSQVVDLSQKENAKNWVTWVKKLAEKHALCLDFGAVNALYQHFVRESENKDWISLSPWVLEKILTQSALTTQCHHLTSQSIFAYFAKQDRQHQTLRKYAHQAILQDHIYIATQGKDVGQINGLSVVEYAGSPQAFGEPVRISCTIQFGDGEVVDVERKNELAGNVHSKSLMVAEACLAYTLRLPSQLPFSARLVFEQNHGEIDGDSASLACFLALVSSLANEAIPQHIAVTGAIDQFGNVHAVGGINQKIEGFFSICQARGLTGNQGVIIPATTLDQLSLHTDVRQAVACGKFTIWAIQDIHQACEILFQQPLFDNEKTHSIAEKIHQRLGGKRGIFSFFR